MAATLRQSKTLLLFIVFLFFFLFLRLWNLSGFLYFIYDQGRDAAKLAEIAQGNITLVGPTTGIAGLYLGPLWYYIGLPGYFLSQGNPVLLSAWFILLSAIAFPFYWWLTTVLFWQDEKESSKNHRISRIIGWLNIALFLVLPASIISSTTIWNPLIAAPLMLAALWSFWNVRQHERKAFWIGLGFFFVACTLQSEFAYAVFFLPVLFLAIPWITQRRKFLDFLAALFAIGVTLVPQLLFELRHQFIMTKSVLGTLSDSSKTVSWTHQFQNRPIQLINTTVDFFNGPDGDPHWLKVVVLSFVVVGIWTVYTLSKKEKNGQTYLAQLITLFALIPYPFYLLWRGNEGNFFSYYLTSHFVFVFPLFVLGLQYGVKKLWQHSIGQIVAGAVVIAALLPLLSGSVAHWYHSVYSPVNFAGLQAMQTAIAKAYQWKQPQHSATLVITPNISSVHYDYLIHWHKKSFQEEAPRTVIEPTDTQLLLIIELQGSRMSDYVIHQRRMVTQGYTQKRGFLSGSVLVEEWVK